MTKKIYDYIAENRYVDIHKIADSLNVREIDVLNTVNHLTQSGYLSISPYILTESCNCSCLYYATKKYIS